MILSFQGFDICDEGFSLTFYQQFFNDPSSVEYCFVYWFSGLIGGIWYELWPNGGILWFRWLAIICNTLSFLVAYKILISYLRQSDVLLGLTMVLFINDYGFLVFYHNQLTTLLSLTSIYFLLKGLDKKNIYFVGLSGILIGLNVFVRLPNLTMLSMVLLIPIHYFVCKKPMKNSAIRIAFFLGGVSIGVFIIFALLFFLNQLGIMKRAVGTILVMGEAQGSSHNFTRLIQVYFDNLKRIASVSAYFIIILIILSFSKRYIRKMTYFTVVITFFLMALFFVGTDIYAAYALGTIGLLFVFFTEGKNPTFKILAFAVFIMMYFLPFGSDGAMNNSGFMCVWLGVPLFFHSLSQINKVSFSIGTKYSKSNFGVNADLLKSLKFIIPISFFGVMVFLISTNAYFDPGSRFLKKFEIQSELASGIATTERRAKIVNELLSELDNYVEPNDYLLAYDNIPMIHFLTKTRPYMYNPWVWIYDPHNFSNKLSRAERDKDTPLPVVVQQKFQTVAYFGDPDITYMDENKPNTHRYNSDRTKSMNHFLRINGYRSVWSNDYFVIYKPQ